MSTASLARGPRGPLAAWETEGSVRFTALEAPEVRSLPASGRSRKHPAIAVNAAGETLVAWSENVTWGSASQLAWQRFAPDGAPLDASRDAGTVPPWGLSSVVALADGRFVVFY